MDANIAKNIKPVIVKHSSASMEDIALAEKLVSYMKAQVQECDPVGWTIVSAYVSAWVISVIYADAYKVTMTLQESQDYIDAVDYARAHNTGAYY